MSIGCPGRSKGERERAVGNPACPRVPFQAGASEASASSPPVPRGASLGEVITISIFKSATTLRCLSRPSWEGCQCSKNSNQTYTSPSKSTKQNCFSLTVPKIFGDFSEAQGHHYGHQSRFTQLRGKTKSKTKQKAAPSAWPQLSLCKSLAKATELTHFRLPDVRRPAAPILGGYLLFIVLAAQPLVQLLLPNTFLRQPPERVLQERKAIEDSPLIFSPCQLLRALSQTLTSSIGLLSFSAEWGLA